MFIHKNFSRSLRFVVMTVVALTLSLGAWAQNISVSGTVTDVNGEPLIGAFVLVQGTQTGTSTDINGKYVVNVPADGTLVFSLMGMKDAVIPVNGKSVINATLEEDAVLLDDVVVVGFGTQKKENLTGSVSSVNVDRVFESKPIVTVEKGLQGVVPGLQITYNTNDQDAPATMKIRGTGSVNGSNKPLILLDGVEIEDMSFINPNNIANISVLKDAASASIYGARAAYGVVLITSKDGSDVKDKVTINYSANFAWQAPINLPKYNTGYNMLAQMEEGIIAKKNTDGGDIEAFGMYYKDMMAGVKNWLDNYYGKDLGPLMVYGRDYEFSPSGTMWAYRVWDPNKEIYKTAFQQTHNLSASGNSGKTNYNISASYNKTDGLFKAAQSQYLERVTANISTNTQLYKWLNIGTRVMYSEKYQEYPQGYGSSDGNGGVIAYSMRFPNFFPFGISDGAWVEEKGEYLNAQTESGKGLYYRHGNGLIAYEPTQTAKNEFLTIGANAKVNITKDLSIYADYTRGMWNYLSKGMRTSTYVANFWSSWAPKQAYSTNDYLSRTWLKKITNTMNAYLDYKLNIKDSHHFNFKVGVNTEDLTYNSNNIQSNGIINLDFPTLNLTTGNKAATVGEVFKDRATAGFFARINYDYKGKYLVEVNGRYDGSSLFKSGDKWAFFPSFSLGYRISEEKFFEPLKQVVSNAKIRASYGSIGNQDISSNWYPFIATVATTSTSWITKDGVTASTVGMPGVLGSSMTWEKIRTLDFGLDLGFFKGDLNLVFDWYQRENVGMLVPRNAISQIAGVSTLPKENSGNLKTTGWELQIDYNHLFDNDLSIFVTATVADAKSKITKWNTSTGALNGYYIGKELGEIWGFQTADAYFTADEAANGIQTAIGIVPISDYQKVLQTGNFRFGEGDVKYVDLNGDGKVDSGAGTIDEHGDAIRIGNTTPRYEYSLRAGAAWKGFDLEVLFQGVGKREAWLTSSVIIPHYEERHMNLFSDQLDYYTPENPNAKFPRPYMGHTGTVNGFSNSGKNNFAPQTKYLSDVSYLRLKNLTVGYTIPQKWSKKIYVEKARVYFSADNLLTFDHLDGALDPESLGGWNDAYGIDELYAGRSTPFCRTISFGVQVTF